MFRMQDQCPLGVLPEQLFPACPTDGGLWFAIPCCLPLAAILKCGTTLCLSKCCSDELSGQSASLLNCIAPAQIHSVFSVFCFVENTVLFLCALSKASTFFPLAGVCSGSMLHLCAAPRVCVVLESCCECSRRVDITYKPPDITFYEFERKMRDAPADFWWQFEFGHHFMSFTVPADQSERVFALHNARKLASGEHRQLNCLEVYAGAGGTSFISNSGEHATITTRWAVDIFDDAVVTFATNHPETSVCPASFMHPSH